MRLLLFVSVVSSVIAACGGANDTQLLGDGGGGGGDGGNNGDVIPPIDGGGSCDITRCAQVPSGFDVVSLVDSATTCPSGFTSTDVVTSPTAGDGVCTCNCNVTAQPDCSTGNITRFLDNLTTPTCGQPATTFPANNGNCAQVGNGGLSLTFAHYATNAPPPTGGTCQYDATVNAQKITTTPARVCAPPASCQGAVCNGGPVCVQQAGDVACPGDFPTKTLVGASATASCSTCSGGCTVGGTCTGTLTFYTDFQCGAGAAKFTADGTCDANPAPNTGPYQSYQFTGSVKSSTCAGNPPTSTGTATLDGPTTVCCRK